MIIARLMKRVVWGKMRRRASGSESPEAEVVEVRIQSVLKRRPKSKDSDWRESMCVMRTSRHFCGNRGKPWPCTSSRATNTATLNSKQQSEQHRKPCPAPNVASRPAECPGRGVRLPVEFACHLAHATAGLVGHPGSIIQREGHRADGHAGPGGDVGDRRTTFAGHGLDYSALVRQYRSHRRLRC